MGKTYRKNKDVEYQDKDRRKSKQSRSCLNGGGCPHCEGNRCHAKRRQEPVDQWDED